MLLHLITLFGIAAVAHWLQVFYIIATAQTAWKNMIDRHQFKICSINIDMKTTRIVSGFNEIQTFFIAGRISTIEAISAENAQPFVCAEFCFQQH